MAAAGDISVIDRQPIGESVVQMGNIILANFRRIPTVTGGGASVATTLQLPRAGVFADSFPVTVRVTRAEWFRAADVAQVRPAAVSGAAYGAVIDFGIARTVSAVATTDSEVDIASANRWLGASFEAASLLAGFELGSGGIRSFSTEVRVERLRIGLDGGGSLDAVRDRIAVQLPEIPADLELRIDGGAPVWTSAGSVTEGELPADAPPLRPVPGKASSGVARWRAESDTDLVQVVDLADVLNALLGDPAAAPTDRREITVSLSARIPGAIALDVPADPDALLRHRARIVEGFVDGRRDVVFTTEGVQHIPLALPAGTTALHAVACTIAGTCDALRTIPPVGPEPDLLSPLLAPGGVSGLARAEFMLDAERSIALRLSADHGLETLSAIRVPLRADRSGCELRVVLLGADAIDVTAPGAQIDGASGKPAAVDANAGGAEQWVTLEFQTPVTLPPAAPVFAALHFIRGTAFMAAVEAAGGGAEGVVAVWRGPPTGPWEALPEGAGLRGFKGRLRLTGTPPADRPIAPLRMAVGRPPVRSDGLTPSSKGVPADLAAPIAGGGTVQLEIVALTPCTVSVRDVVVTVTR